MFRLYIKTNNFLSWPLLRLIVKLSVPTNKIGQIFFIRGIGFIEARVPKKFKYKASISASFVLQM